MSNLSGLTEPAVGLARQFRVELVEKLAYETEFPECVAQTGVVSHDLARELGVLPELLEEAARMVRRGFRSGIANTAVGLGNVSLRIRVQRSRWRRFKVLAKQHHVQPAELLASIFHHAMLTEREPAARPRCFTEPHAYTKCNISKGLAQALSRRAAGVGMPYRTYARCWILDVLEGKVTLPMTPISLLSMYDDPALYVLPVAHMPEPKPG